MQTLASYETTLPSHWYFHIIQISTGPGSERSDTFISPVYQCGKSFAVQSETVDFSLSLCVFLLLEESQTGQK